MNDYDANLRSLGAAARKDGSAMPKASFAELDDLRTRASQRARALERALAEGAPDAVNKDGAPLTEGDLQMLCRIRDNSDQLKGMFQELKAREGKECVFTREDAPPINLLPDEAMTLRKIWEIGKLIAGPNWREQWHGGSPLDWRSCPSRRRDGRRRRRTPRSREGVPPTPRRAPRRRRPDLWALAATMFTLISRRFVHGNLNAYEALGATLMTPAPPLVVRDGGAGRARERG